MFRSTLARRRHRAAARALAVALGAALIAGIAVLWAQAQRAPDATERIAVPALGTSPNPTPTATPTVVAAPGAQAPTSAATPQPAAVPPPVAGPTVAVQPSPPPPAPAQLSEVVNRVQAEAPITFQPARNQLTVQGQQ